MMQPIWNGVLHNLKVNLNAMSLLLWCDRGGAGGFGMPGIQSTINYSP